MNRLLLLFSVGVISLYSYGQEEDGRSLHFYIETAKENSPLITDYRNQTEIEQAELERLKAMYTHSHLELNGDYLFVPIILNIIRLFRSFCFPLCSISYKKAASITLQR